jgi:hypothetical protein
MATRMALEMPMRIFKVLNIAILYVLVGSAAVLYAQDEKQEDHPAAQQDAAKPQPKQDQAHDDNAKVPRQEETKPPKPQEKQDNMREQDQIREQSGKQEAAPGQPDHPGQPGHEGQATPSQRMGNDHPGNNRGGHIPDDQFRARFGREHHFRAQGVIVAGQPQFEYSGYTFELVNPWPADWAYTDDCYVDYVDGEYYLIDLAHPGVEIALIVLM